MNRDLTVIKLDNFNAVLSIRKCLDAGQRWRWLQNVDRMMISSVRNFQNASTSRFRIENLKLNFN
jgi:hypothetical protein